jgi:hypothetical protein
VEASRPALRTILEGPLLRLKDVHEVEGLSADDIAGLVSPVGQLVKGAEVVSPALVKGVVHGAEGLGRRSGARQAESAARTYGAGYEAVVLAAGMALQRNRQTLTTVADTPAGGILEAAIATDVRAKPGVLTLALTEEATGRIRLEATAEFEGQFAGWGSGRRIVDDFFADLERYLRHLEPAWKALPPPGAGASLAAGTLAGEARPPLHSILSGGAGGIPPRFPLAAVQAWVAAVQDPGRLQRLRQAGGSLAKSLGLHKESHAESTLGIGYAHGVLAVAWALQRGGYPLVAAEDTGAGCAFVVRLPTNLLSSGGHLTVEARQEAAGQLRVVCSADTQGQVVDWGRGAKLLRTLLADLDAAVWELAAAAPS